MNKILEKVLENVTTVAIGGHIRPDGDCVGSCMGMYLYLTQNYPNLAVDIYLKDLPDSFTFIHKIEDVKEEIKESEESKDKSYDLFIAQDCGDLGRLGFSGELFEKAGKTFCIDHHVSNQAFADENYIKPDASSTAELVCELLDMTKVSKEVAECLFLGIAHDTGIFQYSCTSPETMNMAALLMEKGIDSPRIIDETYYKKTYVQNQILGKALLESMLLLDGKCIASVITKKDLDFFEATPKDLEGIVSQLRVTTGVEAAIFIYETDVQEFKVSLRASGDVDVNAVAVYFGGGGHKKAAGCSMRGDARDILTNLAKEIEKQLKDN